MKKKKREFLTLAHLLCVFILGVIVSRRGPLRERASLWSEILLNLAENTGLIFMELENSAIHYGATM